MSLFMKQDFTPSILSRKWIAIKFRRNMLLYNREHIIAILESGLLFREDSIEVEQECPSTEEVWKAAGVGSGWLTRGEWGAGIAAVTLCAAIVPPRSFNRFPLHLTCYLSLLATIRTAHRATCRGSLRQLLHIMREYMSLARRAAACMRDTSAVKGLPASVTTTVAAVSALLCRQQSSLATLVSRASRAVLGNAPWLRDNDVEMDVPDDQLLKIHHAFLVLQSTLLKHIAMAHYIPSPHLQKIYKNHNERIYWLHTVLIQHLIDEFKDNFESLERMYRLLKNYGNKDSYPNKKPGKAITDNWLYSDVHSSIARTCLDLKITMEKCNNLDMFLDSCALNNQDIDLNVLNRDIDEIIDELTKCLNTAQSSQIRLKKLQSKFGDNNKDALEVDNDEEEIPKDNRKVIEIDDKPPEVKDEVFYFVKTEDDDKVTAYEGDVSIGPGKKERETTKTVLNELRRKLVKREDVMRERERQALAKTMPELKDNVPEFPRQIKTDEFQDKKGYINKVKRGESYERLFRKYKIQAKNRDKLKRFKLRNKRYDNEDDIEEPLFEANAKLNSKSKLVTLDRRNKTTIVTKWNKIRPVTKELDFSDLSEGLSDVESNTVNRVINQAVNLNQSHQSNGAVNLKFTKKDLELSPSSESDSEHELELLKDIRKHRVVRKKNFGPRRSVDKVEDESLKPIEYTFGTGMAMASMLQVNSSKMPNMAQEEVFIGDGEVSEDSGNDEDA